jgi:hypothetical protein
MLKRTLQAAMSPGGVTYFRHCVASQGILNGIAFVALHLLHQVTYGYENVEAGLLSLNAVTKFLWMHIIVYRSPR